MQYHVERTTSTQNSGIQKAETEVSQVVGLMHENIEALLTRDEKLESLSRRASELEENALALHRRASNHRKRYKIIKLNTQ